MSGSALSSQALRPRKVRFWTVSLLAVVLSLFSASVGVMRGPLGAQESAQKRPLTIAEYKLWRSISGATLSADGKWAAWSYTLVRGDDTLHVVNLDTDAAHVVPLASGPEFSDDGGWVAYFVSPPFEEAEKARREDDPVVRKAELLNLASGEKRSWDGAASFGFAKGSSHFFVKKGRGDGGGGGSGGRSGGSQGAGRNGGDGPQGTDLILRNLREGYDELIGSVYEAGFNKSGTHFAYTVDAADRDGNGLYLVSLTTGARRALDNAKERYSKLTWAEEGDGLAVLHGEAPDKKAERVNTLVAFTSMESGSPRRHVFDAASGQGLPDGSVISEKGSLTWGGDLGTVFVGIKSQEDELEDWPDDAFPLADVNIWHWADDRIQTAQIRQASRDRDRTYLAAVHLSENRLVPLADEGMRTVDLTRDGRWGMGQDDSNFISDWKPDLANYYRVDTRTGERLQLLRAHERTFGFSPDSKHFLYWLDGHIWDYRVEENIHLNLTASSPVDFTDMEFDHFGERPSYGVVGWSSDGESVLLNHRYDVWLQPLDGTPASNLTENRGARDEVRLRYVRTDPEERFIDLDQPLLFSAYGEWTKKEGFFEIRDGNLQELTWEDKRFGRIQKAEDADRYLFTVETFQEFPDLWVSDGGFSGRDRVTVANPQQEEYLWGR
ncbi:MAG: hypothetical protein ABIF09_09065, partial [Gemmatimonadota bacterium]